MTAAGPASAKPPLKRFVYAKRIAAPGKLLTFTVTCPPGWVEMGGEILENPSLMPVLASMPTSANSQRRFSFDNRSNNRPAEVRVRVTCVKFFPPAKKRWVVVGGALKKSRFAPVRLEVQQTIMTPVCPKPRRLVGPGIELRPSGNTPAEKQAAWASVRITGIPVEISKSWIERTKRGERAAFIVGGRSFSNYDIRVSARCLKPVATSGPIGRRAPRPATHRLPIGIRTSSLSGSVQPGINQVKASCPKGFLSVGTGHMFSPGSGLSLFRSLPLAGRGALWEIDSTAKAEVQVEIQAQCLDTRPGWRPIR